jgi:hypothetical protein
MADIGAAQSYSAEHRFFRTLIFAMAAVLVGGFVLQLAMGRSSFNAPLVVHFHAVAFMGWVAIVLMQTHLATSGAIAQHRQLGRIAVAYSVLLLILGPLVTLAAVQTGRAPFFFQPQHFLIANPLGVLAFLGLLIAAVQLRKQTDWHARLQIGALAMLMGPGFGRILPMPFMTPYAFEIAELAALVFILVAMARDMKVHGRAHPAWFWTIGVMVGTLLLARALAFSPIGEAIYAAAIAGIPGANPDGLAYPPPPGPPPG